jgi:hypothetical protein
MQYEEYNNNPHPVEAWQAITLVVSVLFFGGKVLQLW